MANHEDARKFLELLVAKVTSHEDRVNVVRKGLELGVPLREIEDLLDRHEASNFGQQPGQQRQGPQA